MIKLLIFFTLIFTQTFVVLEAAVDQEALTGISLEEDRKMHHDFAVSVTPQFILLKIEDQKRNIFLEGETDPNHISFEGTDIRYRYDSDRYSFLITGIGKITYKQNIILIGSEDVAVNGQRLPIGSFNFVLREDGKLQQGFLKTFD